MISKLFTLNPYSLSKKEKSDMFVNYIKKLTYHHYKNCKSYKKIIKNLKFKIGSTNKLDDFPMLPARMFKIFDLLSVPKKKIIISNRVKFMYKVFL